VTFSQDFIDKVRDANNIVDLFSEYTQLKRSGGRLMGLCPFPGHSEKSPSFSVSEDKQVYYCFGCQRSGQIFTALKELKGYSFPEAVEYLANRAGVIMPTEHASQKINPEVKTRKEKLNKLNTVSAQFFHSQLLKLERSHYALEYCRKRGLTREVVEIFNIGFAPSQWDSLALHLNNIKAPVEMAAELGLIRKRKEGEGYFDLFRDRLMFPIHSHKGECVGFGGRSLTDEQMPKYLNSPESEVFSKGHTFYGLNETAKFIRTENFVVIVEGYMDLIALYLAGIKNVVATLGTALTPYHAKLIKRYTKNIVVLFDGDDAGQKAAVRSLPILLEEELLPKALVLPDELDPDEYLKEKGAASLQEMFKSAPDLFSIVLDRHLRNYRGSSADKVVLLNEVSPYLTVTRDQRLKDLYVSEIAQKIAVEPSWVIKNSKGPSSHAKEADFRHAVTPEMPKDVIDKGAKVILQGAPKAELFLLNISLLNPDRFKTIWESEIVSNMTHAGVREMFLKAEGYYRQMPNEFAKLSAYLMSLTENPNLLGLHLGEPFCSMNDEALSKFTNDCTWQVKEKFLRNQTRELAAALKISPQNERLEKLEQIMNIQKSKHTLRRDRET
jgi:DNA primase